MIPVHVEIQVQIQVQLVVPIHLAQANGFDWQRFGRHHALESSAHSTWGRIWFPQLPTSWEPELAPSNQSAISWQRFGRYN